jgi:hypothetical protein
VSRAPTSAGGLSFAKTAPTFTAETFWPGLDSRVAYGLIALNVTSAPPNVLWIQRNGLCAMRADGIYVQRVCAGRSAVYAACRSRAMTIGGDQWIDGKSL